MKLVASVGASILAAVAANASAGTANVSENVGADWLPLTASVCLYNDVEDRELKISYNFGGETWNDAVIGTHENLIIWTKFEEGQAPSDLMIKFEGSNAGLIETGAAVRPYISRVLKKDCSRSHRMKFIATEGVESEVSLVEQ